MVTHDLKDPPGTKLELHFGFLFQRILPFSVARAISVLAFPAIQGFLAYKNGKIEAGRFFILTSVALFASQIGDLGVSKAFPVLYGSSANDAHPSVKRIQLFRWLCGLLFAGCIIFLKVVGFLDFSLPESCVVGAMLLGRVILLGYQGFHHARSQFWNLWKGALANIGFAVAVILITFQEFSTETAIASLTIGIWAEIVFLYNSDANPSFEFFGGIKENVLSVIGKYFVVGVGGAFYTRIDALVCMLVLSPTQLGVYGTLDAGYKMLVWPSYLIGQAVYPKIQRAWETLDFPSLKREAILHFFWSTIFAMIFGGISAFIWLRSDFKEHWTVFWFALGVPCVIPNAVLIPISFVVGRERSLAFLFVCFGIFRAAIGASLGLNFGTAGIAMIQVLTSALAIPIMAIWFHRAWTSPRLSQ